MHAVEAGTGGIEVRRDCPGSPASSRLATVARLGQCQ